MKNFDTKSKHYAEEQIIGILKEDEAGAGMANLMRKHKAPRKLPPVKVEVRRRRGGGAKASSRA